MNLRKSLKEDRKKGIHEFQDNGNTSPNMSLSCRAIPTAPVSDSHNTLSHPINLFLAGPPNTLQNGMARSRRIVTPGNQKFSKESPESAPGAVLCVTPWWAGMDLAQQQMWEAI